MRVVTLVVALLCGGSGPAVAQELNKLSEARGHLIAVIDTDSKEWQGRLLEITKTSIVVEVDSAARRFELAAVKRVDAHGDRTIDGLIKGALFGTVLSLVMVGPRYVPGAAAIYGLIGLGADAMNNCHHTVYRRQPVAASATFSW